MSRYQIMVGLLVTVAMLQISKGDSSSASSESSSESSSEESSDESSTEEQTCNGLQCDNYQCVSGSRCDGVKDCDDLSDEKNCPVDIPDDCLDCICGVASNSGNPGCGSSPTTSMECSEGCIFVGGECCCGPFHITNAYFTDCSAPWVPNATPLPLPGWVECANTVECATICIRNYMQRYATTCTGEATTSSLTCELVASLHKVGPSGCSNKPTDYLNLVANCLGGGGDGGGGGSDTA